MSARRSQRIVRRRKRADQARVRSTTQRWRPRRSERSTPRRAMRGVIDRSRRSVRQRRWSQALSARSLFGRQRGRPRPRRTPGTTSSTAASMRLSCRLAPLSSKPSGVPRASTTRWRLVPGRPRSVGFGPIFVFGDERPLLRGWTRCRSRHGSSRARPPRPGAPAAHGAGRPARRSGPPSNRWRAAPHPASPAAGASRACPGPRSGVMPVQPNRSRGSIAQAMPERSTNTMPSKAARSSPRSSHRARPPFGFGGSSGSRSATAAHSPSLTRGLMAPQRTNGGCC